MTITERRELLNRQIKNLQEAEDKKIQLDAETENLRRARRKADLAYREYRKLRSAAPAQTLADLALELAVLSALERGEGGKCAFEQTQGEIWVVVGVRKDIEVELTTLRRPRIRRTLANVSTGKAENGYRFFDLPRAVRNYLESWRCP